MNTVILFFVTLLLVMSVSVFQLNSVELLSVRLLIGFLLGGSIGLTLFLKIVKRDNALRFFISSIFLLSYTIFYFFSSTASLNSLILVFFISVIFFFILDKRWWPTQN